MSTAPPIPTAAEARQASADAAHQHYESAVTVIIDRARNAINDATERGQRRALVQTSLEGRHLVAPANNAARTVAAALEGLGYTVTITESSPFLHGYLTIIWEDDQ